AGCFRRRRRRRRLLLEGGSGLRAGCAGCSIDPAPSRSDAMTVEADLPPVAEVVIEFERVLCGERRVSPNPVLSVLFELHDSNVRQWDLEDLTRVPEASDSVVADAKRAIDELNLTRHHLIQEIDAAVHANLRQSTTAAFATESPGMVF